MYVAGHGVFIHNSTARIPGAVRKRLEAVLKEHLRREGKLPSKSEEERIVQKARRRANSQRNVQKAVANRAANGERWIPPWLRPRTVSAVVNEERTLDITRRYNRLGEVR